MKSRLLLLPLLILVVMVGACTAKGTVPEPESTPSPEPTGLSLSGRIAFYSRSDPTGVRVMNADGSNVSDRLTTEWSCDPDWSPDGTKIAFIVGDNQVGYNICTMNADGTGVVQLTQGQHIWDHPDWSPDGKKIVFSADLGSSLVGTVYSGGRIMVMDADGSNQTVLYTGGWAGYPAWSPDGEYIAFAASYEESSNRDIQIMNADGSGVRRLAQDPADDSEPAWSPDGKYIAFVSDRDGDDNTELYVMNADGSGVTQLTKKTWSDIRLPCWSPDSKYIAYCLRDSSWLYVISADGSQEVEIKEVGLDPSWTR